ncbi:MAG: Rieske 2Fe-2S domain-containing protein [Rhodanobacteraceae bacterium]
MNESTYLCRFQDIPDGGALGVGVTHNAQPVELILLRRGANVFAFHNECPHAGRNLDYVPGKFLVAHGRIVCAVHGATYATDSGACVAGPCRSGLVAASIKIVDGGVRLC